MKPSAQLSPHGSYLVHTICKYRESKWKGLFLVAETCMLICITTVCPSDRGNVLWCCGGDGSGIHWNLPRSGEQRYGIQSAGAPQQGDGHQHC